MDLQSVRAAFLCQLCPTVSQEERKKAFNLVQQFKSSPANSQIKIIFALIADQDGKFNILTLISTFLSKLQKFSCKDLYLCFQ